MRILVFVRWLFFFNFAVMNTYGQILRLTSFGESHGAAMGGVIDGFPANFVVDFDKVDVALSRRRPGQSALTTARRESDSVEFLSGIVGNVTLGTPIGFIVRNGDRRSQDYDEWADLYRPSHADYSWEKRFGIIDRRGGGRASARETVSRVVAGALAAQVLEKEGIKVCAWSSAIGDVCFDGEGPYAAEDVYSQATRCPDKDAARKMEAAILAAKEEGDTLGGVVSCVVTGVKAGVGNPVFGKLQARLAAAMMSIPAAHGFEYGMGFAGAAKKGSEMIDVFVPSEDGPRTLTNHSGGIQGGVTNGNDITMRVAFKPLATLMRPVETVDVNGRAAVMMPRGRHDVCAVPRAVAVVEAMASLTILDSLLETSR